MTPAALRSLLGRVIRPDLLTESPREGEEARLALNLCAADVLVAVFVSVLLAVLALATARPWAMGPGLLAAALVVIAGLKCFRLPAPVRWGMVRPIPGFAGAGIIVACLALLAGTWLLWAVAAALAVFHLMISGRRFILSRVPGGFSGKSGLLRSPRVQRFMLAAIAGQLRAVAFVSRLQRIFSRHGGAYLCSRCGHRFRDPHFAFGRAGGWRSCEDTSLWPQPEHPILTLLPDGRPLFLASPLQRLIEAEDIDFKPRDCRRPNCGSRHDRRADRDILILAPSLQALDSFGAAVGAPGIRRAAPGISRGSWSMDFSIKAPGGKSTAVNARVILLPSGWPAVDDVSLVLAIPEGDDSDSDLTPRQQVLALLAGVSFEPLAPPRARIPARLHSWRARFGRLLRALFLGEVKDSDLHTGNQGGYRLAAWVQPDDAPDEFEGVPVSAVQMSDQLAALLRP